MIHLGFTTLLKIPTYSSLTHKHSPKGTQRHAYKCVHKQTTTALYSHCKSYGDALFIETQFAQDHIHYLALYISNFLQTACWPFGEILDSKVMDKRDLGIRRSTNHFFTLAQ